MKRVLALAILLLLPAATGISRGRGNYVHHVYEDGSVKVFLASEGSCRHHLTAHPLDVVMGADGGVHDAAACN
ncbi:MAG: hypothetical protein LLG20_17395 [Acidobacteriales bacterium]|nr:hypothetical protein [Terriglobales bacterium]